MTRPLDPCCEIFADDDLPPAPDWRPEIPFAKAGRFTPADLLTLADAG
jgi:hypothetical protein